MKSIIEQAVTVEMQDCARLTQLLLVDGAKVLQKFIKHHRYLSTCSNASSDTCSSPEVQPDIANMNLYQLCSQIDTTLTTDSLDMVETERQKLRVSAARLKGTGSRLLLYHNANGVEQDRFAEMIQEMSGFIKPFLINAADIKKFDKAVEQARPENTNRPSINKREVSQLRAQLLACQHADDLNTKQLISVIRDRLETQSVDTKALIQTMQLGTENLNDALGVFRQFTQTGKFSSIQSLDVNIAALRGDVVEGFTGLNAKVDELLEETKQSHQNRVDESRERKEQLDEVLHYVKPPEDVDVAVLEDVKEVFESTEPSFNILIMNTPDDEQIISLGETLGRGPWDFIIDFNHATRMHGGLHDKMIAELQKRKYFHVILHNDDINLSESSKEHVAAGEKEGIWFLANGCSEEKIDEPETFGVLIEALKPLLKDVIKVIPFRKPIIVTLCLFSDTNIPEIKKFMSRFEDVCDLFPKQIKFGKSRSLYLTFSPNIDIKLDTSDSGHLQIKPVQVPTTSQQLAYTLKSMFSEEDLTETLTYPGNKGPCRLPKEDLTRLETMMTLYHNKIGHIDFASLSEDERIKNAERNDQIKKRRVQYLKGGEISPECFYLHQHYPTHPFYALRSEMLEAKTKIEKQLEQLPKDTSYRSQFTIEHDPSGGGSTVLGYVLYQLKDTFPCILLHSTDHGVVKSLEGIWKNSKKPLLVAIDKLDTDPQPLIKSLRNSDSPMKCLVVNVKSNLEKRPVDVKFNVGRTTKRPSEDKTYIFVPAKLKTQEDKAKFQDIYNEFKDYVTASKVYLFGLNAFCEDYERLPRVVENCFKSANECQVQILRIVCCLHKYAAFGVKTQLIATLWTGSPLDDELDRESSILKVLGPMSDLIIYDEAKHVIRVIHNCIVEPVYAELEKKNSKREIHAKHVEDMIALVQNDSPEKKLSGSLCTKLFMVKTVKEYYSPFLSVLISLYKRSDELKTVSKYFLKLLEQLSTDQFQTQNHMRMVYARFLIYELRGESASEDSTFQIKSAIDLKTSETITSGGQPLKNHNLLSSYGNMFSHIIFRKFDARVKSCSGENRRQLIEKLTIDVKECIAAFSLAETTSRNDTSFGILYSSVPFVNEATVRNKFLERIYRHVCEGNNRKFHHHIITHKDDFMKYCSKGALDALDKVENLEQRGELHDPNPDMTASSIIRTKLQILSLGHDGNGSYFRALSEVKVNVPCDIGLLVRIGEEMSFRHVEGQEQYSRRPVLRQWSELEENDLVKIIETIRKRIGTKYMLVCNYSDMISAMIYLRQIENPQKDYGMYTLDMATAVAKTWQKMCPDNFNAHFMYAVLSFGQAIEQPASDHIDHFETSFAVCQDMLKTKPVAKGKKRQRFIIGKGSGLSKIIPYSWDIVNEQNERLYSFKGRVLNDRLVSITMFKELKADLVAKSKHSLPLASRPRLQFNISIASDALIALNGNTLRTMESAEKNTD